MCVIWGPLYADFRQEAKTEAVLEVSGSVVPFQREGASTYSIEVSDFQFIPDAELDDHNVCAVSASITYTNMVADYVDIDNDNGDIAAEVFGCPNR
jgi:hypothetical protein